MTSSKVLGQILACPKCRSMVLVPESPPHQGLPTDAANRDSSVSRLSDSFENIDSLLDDGSSSGTASAASSADRGTRWKSSDEPDLEKSPDGAGDAVGTGDADSALPIGSVSTMTLQKYFLLVGAVIFGAVAAVGAIVISSGSDDATQAVRNDPAIQREQTVQDDANVNPVDTTEKSVDTTSQEETIPDPAPVAGTPGRPSETNEPPPETEPAADRSPPVAVSDAVDQSEDQVASPDEPDESPPSTIAGSDGLRLVTGDAAEQDDELAGFVDWLRQDPDQFVADEKVDNGPPLDDDHAAPVYVEPIASANRSMPPPVDVDARLKDEITAVSFKEIPWVDAIRTIEGISTIPISIEPDALARYRLSPRANISLLRTNTTVGELLDDVLMSVSKGKLTPIVSPGHVRITTRSLSRYSPYVHKTDDLVDSAEENVILANWIQEFVAPGTWSTDGGRGMCAPKSGGIEVTHNSLTQYRVLRFLERLRAARGLPHRVKLPNDQASVVPRLLRTELLAEPVSARFPIGATISRIASHLEHQSNVTILVDWPSVYVGGWSPRDEVPLFCDGVPLEQAMTQWLRPLGLEFNVVDRQTVQIIYPGEDPSYDIEFYELPGGSDAETTQKTVAHIAAATNLRASTVWDSKSQRVIVAAPQSVHRRLMSVWDNN